MKLKLLIISNFFILLGFSKDIQIVWNKADESGFFSFNNMNHIDEFGELPIYGYTEIMEGEISSYDVAFEVKETAPLSNAEKALLTGIKIPQQFEVVKTIACSGKKGVAAVYITTIRERVDGQLEKLIRFDLTLNNVILKEKNYAKKSSYKSSPSSILATGNWYKISVSSTGIYKIDKQFFKDHSIDISGVNPQNFRIYGNGEGMLSEENSKQKYFDLQENAIEVVGEGDGVFDDNDYILFYANGPHQWKYDSTKKKYSHSFNIYDEKSYYFINFDLGAGKRINTQAQSLSTPTDTAKNFEDYAFYENDKVNFQSTGRAWYGPALTVNSEEETHSFNFPNIDITDTTLFNAEFATRSTQTSGNNVYFDLNNSNFLSVINISKITSGTYNDYATLSTKKDILISPTSDNLNVKMRYAAPLNEAECYLNYMEVITHRHLIMNGSSMNFRNSRLVGSGKIARFSISVPSSNYKIWDISDVLNVHEQISDYNTGYLNFNQNSDVLKEYVILTGNNFSSPTYLYQIANQDIHVQAPVDYVIVSAPEFLNSANTLAQFHQQKNGLKVLVVTPEQVYNEFSSGAKDISAIRNMMRYFYDTASTPQELPKYLLLFGDAHYNYKNIELPKYPGKTAYDFVPTYESPESMNIGNSYCSDDFYGFLDITEGDMTKTNYVDIGIGRMPISTTEQAAAIVNKIINYSGFGNQITSEAPSVIPTVNSVYGNWKNDIVFIADDGSDPQGYSDYDDFILGSENLAQVVHSIDSNFNMKKIYFDAYKKEITAAGGKYPDVDLAIKNVMENGALIVNYVGHGGEGGWADERVLLEKDIEQWSNSTKLPFFVTATCEFSRYDDYRVCAGEKALLNLTGGVVGQLTTSRLVYNGPNLDLVEKFYDAQFVTGPHPTLGNAIMTAKITTAGEGTNNNKRKFYLMGDPALTLAFPKEKVVTTKINLIDVNIGGDTLHALTKAKIEGKVVNSNDVFLSNYRGILTVVVYDKTQTNQTLNNTGKGSIDYALQNSILYKGKASVTNGVFTIEFIVPKDINYQYGNGRISYYIANDTNDARGFFEDVIIGGTAQGSFSDNEGPKVNLYMNDSTFIFGGLTDENPKIYATVYDESGVNTTGNTIGHDVAAVLDNQTNNTIILNSNYEAELNNYQKGKIQYPLNDLNPGLHNLSLKVWDVNNNSSTAYTEFIVENSAKLALEHVLNYPNPFTSNTQFWFEHNQQGGMLDVQIQILTINGRVVKTIQTTIDGTQRYKPEPIPWDGTDDFGDAIGKGVYIYKLKVKTEDGKQDEKLEKLVILK